MTAPHLPPRLEYGDRSFDSTDLTADPMELFAHWFDEAVLSGLPEANGVCLSTNDSKGEGGGPNGRIVLMKDYGPRGFTFFSNYESCKGRELASDPRASMVFWWQPLKRQVRILGAVERLPSLESDAYFHSRPRESQLGAWASSQSTAIESRAVLDSRLREISERFPEGAEVPRPAHWGGYLLVPRRIEFWQGRDSRLHDRFAYERQDSQDWAVARLMP